MKTIILMTKTSLRQLVTLLFFSVMSTQAFSLGDFWDTRAAMPAPRSVQSIGVIDGKLYSPGVVPGSYFAPVLDRYDPATDTWTRGRASSVKRGAAASGVIDRKLYLAGGCLGFGSTGPDCRIGTTGLLEVYDPDSDMWATLTPMPAARSMMAGAVINGKLHVMGGNATCGSCIPLNTHWAYDPVSNSWGAQAPMPVAVNNAAAVAISGKLYIVGGQPGAYTTGMLQVYDPVANSWDTSSAPMPTDRSSHAVGVIDEQLYVAGGTNPGNGILDTLEKYDPVMNMWTTMTPMPTARWVLGAGVIDDKLYVAGGGSAGGVLATLEVYTPLSRVIDVAIDIKPDSSANRINPKSQGVIPVAVLGSVNFDATQVDFATVRFGPNETITVHDGHIVDVNDDDFADIVFHFKVRDAGVVCSDTYVSLIGETFDGDSITATDEVVTVGCQ